MTGNIINEGSNVFIPIMDKIGNIAGEFIPYMLYIGIGCILITLAYTTVKYILLYIQYQSNDTFNVNRFSKHGDVYVNKPMKEERKIALEEANSERDIEKEMYQDYEDYIYKHGKYKDGNYPTQEERLDRIRKRKSEHKEYNYF